MARSLNRVTLIGNLTRDPELRYTPQGNAVCSFGVATNRRWTTDSGETKEDAEFHRVVAWNKLAEICGQLLNKGNRAFVEGRLKTRSWTGQDGNPRQTTEIVITDMILLSQKSGESQAVSEDEFDVPEDIPIEDLSEKKAASEAKSEETAEEKTQEKKAAPKAKKASKKKASEESQDQDVPF